MRILFLTVVAAGSLAVAACADPAPDGAASGGEAAPSGKAASDAQPVPSPPAAPGREGAAPPAKPAAGEVDSNPPGDACGASKVAAFVSQEATPAVRARLAREVGHDRIRWVGPDTVVTMDFRPDRLNVTLDANDIITGGKCS
ncbi:I78 family peptidase inhibitor [Tsuneonella sp. SYSU-LHT278]|uniref:I78 family peptidase inhibitor n=1 Tax=Tsuneonella sediminis TaxID=3416089 RepID=UPI003F7AEC15